MITMAYAGSAAQPATRFSKTLHDEPIQRLSHSCSHLPQFRDHGCDPIAFLDSQLFCTGDDGLALCHDCRHAQDRKFIDHSRNPLGADADSVQGSGADKKVCDRLAGFVPLIGHLDVGSHLGQNLQHAGTSRVYPNPQNGHLRFWHDAGAHQEKSSGGEVTRYQEIFPRPSDGRPALQDYRLAVFLDRNPKIPEQTLGVIA